MQRSDINLERAMIGTSSLATVEAPRSKVELLHRRVERVAQCRVQLDHHHALFLATRDTQKDAIDQFTGGPRFESAHEIVPTSTVLPRGHELRTLARGKGETEYIAVLLEDSIFDEILAGFERSEPGLEILPVARSLDPILISLGLRLKRELACSDFGRGIAIELACQELALHLLRFHSNLQPKAPGRRLEPTDARIGRAREYIHANLDHDMSLQELSNVAGMSRYHFARCFRNAVGDPPHRYVLKQRIALAKLLLRGPNTSIAEVALQCGFGDQGHFGRRFKELTGMTPRHYRSETR